jgi:nitrilase
MPDFFASLGGLCREHGIAAVFGGVPVADGDGIANASLAFDADGTLLARYDKMHLFQLDPGQPGGVDETRLYSYGPGALDFEHKGWKIGLSICYDMRFPELYRVYAPCDLLICTAAFTATTGRAHWEILLRARAIENLCYMAAAGQCGTNAETGIDHFGESMIVDPWGEVVARVPGKREGIVHRTLEKARIAECRRRLPALEHRRI